jgi:hypothetical protein
MHPIGIKSIAICYPWNPLLSQSLSQLEPAGGKCHFHLQVRKISHARNQGEAGYSSMLATYFLAWHIFYPEDGGDMLIRNVGSFSTNYKALYPG